jgi:hypothetical protein
LHSSNEWVFLLDSIWAIYFNPRSQLLLLLIFVENCFRVDRRLDVLEFVIKPKILFRNMLKRLKPLGVVHRRKHFEPFVEVTWLCWCLYEPLTLRRK